MFRHVLENELKKRRLSIREAAQQIGISHSTLTAARDGARKTDIETALLIARWVGSPLSTIIERADPEAVEKNSVLQALSIVLQASPELSKVFVEAAREIEAGRLTMGDFRDIVEYAAYKIRTRREQALYNEQSTSTEAGG